MKALFTASVQSKKGVTGTSQPQALFVEPDITPRTEGDLPGQEYHILLEDVFEINGVCRLVVVGDIDPAQVSIFTYLWFENPSPLLARVVVQSPTITLNPELPDEYDSISLPDEFTSADQHFTNTLTVTIPSNSTEPKRYGLGTSPRFGITEKAYSYCKATAP